MIYHYNGKAYPEYLKRGNAMQYIEPIARQFCRGRGLDIGSSQWPLPGSSPVEIKEGLDAMNLPEVEYDYIFSSHCLEHLPDTEAALLHWKSRLRAGGVLFLYLPHHDMEYWLPENCEKHLHSWRPEEMAAIVERLGFIDVLHSERDMVWSFAVTGVKNG